MATAVSARVFKNFINGEWVAPKCGKTHLNHNPANNGEVSIKVSLLAILFCLA